MIGDFNPHDENTTVFPVNCRRFEAIAGNLKQLSVAVYFKQLPETAGFLRNCRVFLPEISVFNLLYFLKKKCVRSKTMRKLFLPLVNEQNQFLYTGLNCELGQLGWRFVSV
jgi:hypothetical protein